MKNLKHIKLFESFSEGEKVFFIMQVEDSIFCGVLNPEDAARAKAAAASYKSQSEYADLITINAFPYNGEKYWVLDHNGDHTITDTPDVDDEIYASHEEISDNGMIQVAYMIGHGYNPKEISIDQFIDGLENHNI